MKEASPSERKQQEKCLNRHLLEQAAELSTRLAEFEEKKQEESFGGLV